jgi:hypothetical protein
MSNEVIAKDKQDWWRLVRQDLAQWNLKNHNEDNLSIQDWIGEVGPKIHGGIAFRDRYGDWDVSLSDHDEDEEDSW